MPAPANAEARRIYDLERSRVFHSWSAQGSLDPLVITGAEGSYVIDGDGNRILDFSSQLVYTNIGHQHPKVVAAIAEQAANLCTIAPQHANEASGHRRRPDLSGRPRGLQPGVLHQRRRRRRRARDPDGPGVHRPLQDAVDLPQLPRWHCSHRQPDR